MAVLLWVCGTAGCAVGLDDDGAERNSACLAGESGCGSGGGLATGGGAPPPEGPTTGGMSSVAVTGGSGGTALSTGGSGATAMDAGADAGAADTGPPDATAAPDSGGEPDAGDPGEGGASAPTCESNPGDDSDGDVNIDLATEHQDISGFGGINVPGWIDDLTAAQADTAFGNGPGQLGLSILRVRIPHNPGEFSGEVPTAQRAVSHGALVFASPWTPPASLKTNNNIVGGELRADAYEAYADHLLAFRDHMESNGVPIHAISVQNEPDIEVEYESCDWSAPQFITWLTGQGPRFGDTRLIAAESFNFSRSITDAILNDPAAEPQVDIVGGHIYGNGLYDYPLARTKGKEVWMTEHYTDSANPANLWPLALDVGKEIHDCMAANFSAYVWWYIRRSYGLITDDGNVSKRGYLMAQYSKYVRPGFVRVAATAAPASNVHVTAYKHQDGQVVVVAVNMGGSPEEVTLDLYGACIERFDKVTTSATKDLSEDGSVSVSDHRASVTLDAQSVTTFIGQPLGL